MIISVDAGKHLTKCMAMDSEVKTFSVRTKADEIGDGDLNREGRTFSIEYTGKNYRIGEGAANADYDATKNKLLHRLTTYTATAMLANAKEVDIITGCPLTQWMNPDTREAYAQYILGSRFHKITVNGHPKSFLISSVRVLPESIGVIINNADDYVDAVTGVIDIGGVTTNAAVYEHLRPLQNTAYTTNEGGANLYAKIRRALNTALGRNYHDYEIPGVMAGSDSRAKAIIDEILRGHLSTIIDNCRAYDWNVGTLPIVFTGGGSLLLENYIRELPYARVSTNAVWDNCRGYLRLKELMTK